MSGRGVNKVTLIGNLGADPEVRYTQSGDAVANLRLATSETWKDKQTGEARESTEWHRVVLWRGLAEIASQYLHKGSRVYIEGQLKTRKWQDQNGQDRYTTEIEAKDMEMLDGRRDDQRQDQGGHQQRGQQHQGHGGQQQRGGNGRQQQHRGNGGYQGQSGNGGYQQQGNFQAPPNMGGFDDDVPF